MFKALYDWRYFILESVRREFRSRYTNSLLGAGWAVLNPLSMIAVYTLIFSQVMRAKLPGIESGFAYSIYLCSGVLPWGLFTETSTRCVNVFLEQANLLKKVRIPKICLPMIICGSSLLNFVIIMGLFIAFLLAYGLFPGVVILGCLPLVALLLIMAVSIGIFLGTVNVFFRDVGQLFGVITQFWFWFTPLVYPESIVPERFQWLFSWNPLYEIMRSFHIIFLEHAWPDYTRLWPVTLGTLALAFFSLHFFRTHSEEIVDEL